ncbi:MAG: hypothetical protein J6T99_07120 [Oscillospiraceae bacterium]|nr:hypothetical protein [Oscillospiraceae bacterium]
MSRINSFSIANAPILTGKQTVKFAPEALEYFKAHGEFPENRDGRGDYIHLQFLFENGAKTASYKEDMLERNPKYLDNVKLYYDGKYDGDGFQMKLTYQELKKRDKRYANMLMNDILLDLVKKGSFTVWLYRYESKGKGYLQVAWNQEQYNRLTQKSKPQQKKKAEAVEEALPFDI